MLKIVLILNFRSIMVDLLKNEPTCLNQYINTYMGIMTHIGIYFLKISSKKNVFELYC